MTERNVSLRRDSLYAPLSNAFAAVPGKDQAKANFAVDFLTASMPRSLLRHILYLFQVSPNVFLYFLIFDSNEIKYSLYFT